MNFLNLGCGYQPVEDAINIDISDKSYANVILNLDDKNFKFEYEDNYFFAIYAKHLLEHITNIIPLMNECYRVLDYGGTMFIKVPQGDGMFADPTHVRFFNKMSWRYFCGYPFSEIYGITCNFKLKKCEFIDNEDGGELYVILEK